MSTDLIKKIAPFSVLILILLVFRDYLFGPLVYLFTDIGNDTMTLFYPHMLAAQHDEFRNGLNTWTFSRGIGQGVWSLNFDITSWPLYFLSSKGVASYIIWMQVIRILLGGFFIYKYFKTRELGSYTSYIATLLYVTGGYIICTSGWYGHTSYMMFFALFMWGIELLIQRKNWWVLTIAFVFIFNDKIIFLLEFGILYYIVRIIEEKELNFNYVLKDVLSGLKGGFLSLLILAPILGSRVYRFIYSPRVSGDVGYEDRLQNVPMFASPNAMEVKSQLLSFFSPIIQGTGDDYDGWYNFLEKPHLYIGLLTLVLFTQAFALFGKRQRIAYGILILFWTIILAFPYFRYAFYLFAGNYYKSGVNVFLPFSMLYLSMVSLDKIVAEKKINIWVLLGTVLLAIILLVTYSSGSKNLLAVPISIVLLVAYPLIIFGITRFKDSKVPLIALAVIVFGEGYYNSFKSLDKRKTITKETLKQRKNHNDYTLEALNYIKSNNKPFYRIEKTYGSYLSGYNDAQAQGYYSSKSYNSHNHNNYISFLRNYDLLQSEEEVATRWVIGMVSHVACHPFFNTKYVLSTKETDQYVWNNYYKRVANNNGINIYENLAYIPFGIPIGAYYSEQEFNRMTDRESKNMSLYTGVVIQDEDLDKVKDMRQARASQVLPRYELIPKAEELSKKAMVMESFSESQIKGSISNDKTTILTFSMPFDAGWSVTVDGEQEQLLNINYGLAGVKLNPGNHTIELKYSPPYIYQGFVLMLIGLGLLAWIIFNYTRRRRETL